MKNNIIVDSCCDLTPTLREKYGVISVPLSLNLGTETFIDDDNLDVNEYLAKMKAYKGKAGSACPSPEMYRKAFESNDQSYAVTLSANLSGSYSSAIIGKTLAEENGADVHVFDSKSASAGEILIVMKIRQMLEKEIEKINIVESIENFIKNMKTFFVLDSLDNLVKNGRMNKIVGKLISVLNIRPILGSDGDGNIALYSHARGEKQIVTKLIDTIKNSNKPTDGLTLVITHCNNKPLAESLKYSIVNFFNFKEIIILSTRGLSSLYADNKGIILAF